MLSDILSFFILFIETFIVERTFLPCFIAGKPNLVICPQSKYCVGVKLKLINSGAQIIGNIDLSVRHLR